MKKVLVLFLNCCFILASFGQGLWIQKTTGPGTNNSVTIGSKAYVYTGGAAHNFFAYDPVANTWTALADFPGAARSNSSAFATDSFAYVGIGGGLRDFYKYDPLANVWSSIANYPDTGVSGASSFGINNIGYVAGGVLDTGSNSKKCFAYDQTTNTWSPVAPLPHSMINGFSAVANSKGYCGFGGIDSVYEYDPSSNAWSAKATYAIASYPSSWYSFVINNKIYVCDPNAYTNHANIHILDPVANTWSVTNVFPYPTSGSCNPLTPSVGFSIGNYGYLGGNNSCIGTTFWQYDTAHFFSVTAVAPDTICQDDSFTVSISSNLAFGSSNYFKVRGNGASQNFVSDSVPGTANGTYTFKLPHYTFNNNITITNLTVLSTNPVRQSEYSASNFEVKSNPSELPLATEWRSCGGTSAILLYRNNTSLESNLWTSNPPGVHDTTYSLSFTPTQNTTIYVYNVYRPTGCSVRDSTIVYYYTNPGLNIADSSFSICPGTTATLGGTSSPDCIYSWTGGTTSSSVNPSVSPAASSTYHLFVKDTISGCSVSGNTTVTVKAPPAQTICFVTVDTASTHNIVVWEKLDKYATDSFYIFRETSTNVYTQIAAIHRDSLSEYHDYAANPNVTAYRYKISAGDTCANVGVESPYHNTIHLQYLGGGNLIWNVYEIENVSSTPVASFDVYWDTLANGNWQVMINVPGNQYTATDINFGRHPTARYRIVANWSYSCTPSRSANNQVLSNIIQLGPSGINSIDAGQTLSIYPNPAKQELFINSTLDIQEITMISAEGKLVATMHPMNGRIDVSALADGIYIAEIKVNNTIQRIKWVKM